MPANDKYYIKESYQMAKMNEEMVVIKVSELIKDDANASAILTDDMLEGVEAVVQELVGEGKLVEIIKEV